MLTPIQTRYAGYLFRSRLEARWAVYFDALGITWEYEKEGYDLGNLGWYLPDFWLPQVSSWAEVKPERFTHHEYAKCERLAIGTKHPVILLEGMPDNRWYWQLEPSGQYAGTTEVFVSNYHGYNTGEHRFYCCPGARTPDLEGVLTSEIANAINAARSARFEHGRNGAQ